MEPELTRAFFVLRRGNSATANSRSAQGWQDARLLMKPLESTIKFAGI